MFSPITLTEPKKIEINPVPQKVEAVVKASNGKITKEQPAKKTKDDYKKKKLPPATKKKQEKKRYSTSMFDVEV